MKNFFFYAAYYLIGHKYTINKVCRISTKTTMNEHSTVLHIL